MTEVQQRKEFPPHTALWYGLVILSVLSAELLLSDVRKYEPAIFLQYAAVEILVLLLWLVGLWYFRRRRIVVTTGGIFRQGWKTEILVQWDQVGEVSVSPEELTVSLETGREISFGPIEVHAWDEFVACVRSHGAEERFCVIPEQTQEEIEKYLSTSNWRLLPILILGAVGFWGGGLLGGLWINSILGLCAGVMVDAMYSRRQWKMLHGQRPNPFWKVIVWFVLLVPAQAMHFAHIDRHDPWSARAGAWLFYLAGLLIGMSLASLVTKRLFRRAFAGIAASNSKTDGEPSRGSTLGNPLTRE